MLSGSYSSTVGKSYDASSSMSLSAFFGNVAKAEQTLDAAMAGGADALFSVEGSRGFLNSGPAANLMGFNRFGSSANYTGGMGAGMGVGGMPMGANVMVGGPPPGVVGAGIYQGPLVFGAATPPQAPMAIQPSLSSPQGSGGAGAAGGGTNVHASGGSSKADRVTSEMRDKATDTVMGMGYTSDDAKKIVEMAEKASGGDRRRFGEILGKLPQHPEAFEDKKDGQGRVTESAQKQRENFAREFGNWQARYLENVDRNKSASESRQQLVADAGSQGGASYKLNKESVPGTPMWGYRVESASGNGKQVNEGALVFYDPASKRWYQDKEKKQELNISGTVTPSGKKGETITTGGGSDAMGLTPAGTHAMEADVGTEKYKKVYERYEVTEENVSGSKASETFKAIPVAKDGKRYVYYSRTSKSWAYLQEDGKKFQPIPGVRLVDGRLYFSPADTVDPAAADDVGGYLTRMHDAATSAATRRDTMATGAEAQRKERVDQVMTQLREPIAEKNRGSLEHTFTYDAQKREGVLSLNVIGDEAARKAVLEGLGGDATAKDARGDAILGQLPEGTRISVNGGNSFPASTGAYKQIRDEVKRGAPQDAKISEPVDMKSMTETGPAAQDAVYNRLHGMVEKQRGDGTLKSVEFSGPITLDSSKVSLDDWGKVVARLRDAYPNVPITFAGPVKGSDGMSYASMNDARNQKVTVDTTKVKDAPKSEEKKPEAAPQQPATTKTVVDNSQQQRVTPAAAGDVGSSDVAKQQRDAAVNKTYSARAEAARAMRAMDAAIQSNASDKLAKIAAAEQALTRLQESVTAADKLLADQNDPDNQRRFVAENRKYYEAQRSIVLNAGRKAV